MLQFYDYRKVDMVQKIMAEYLKISLAWNLNKFGISLSLLLPFCTFFGDLPFCNIYWRYPNIVPKPFWSLKCTKYIIFKIYVLPVEC